MSGRKTIQRAEGRADDQLRTVNFTRDYTRHAEGSVLAEFGSTRVLCTATVEDQVPPFLRGKKRGWVTAEYAMLPRAAHTRIRRDAARAGRSQEIQRLIGRSLRAVVDFEMLGERTVVVDCDVIQADGSTRTAAISGAYIALRDACRYLLDKSLVREDPVHGMVAAVSVGICNGALLLDLDYNEDSRAEADVNVVMNEALRFIEVQGTAEGHAVSQQDLDALLTLARKGIKEIVAAQQMALARTLRRAGR